MRGLQTTVGWGNIRSTYDTVVIGAGPAGCAAAACFAARGASVLLVESNPKAARRFAGEWIHPEGVRVLKANGLLEGLDNGVVTSGFVVFPNDGLGPIQLDYPGTTTGLACEHETLVNHVRRRVTELPRVDYAEGVRAQPVGGDAVDLVAPGESVKRVHAQLVAVATGRSSRDLVSPNATREEQVSISRMAGLVVADSQLPCEGYGHVLLGGPGPVLAYRIDASRIRLCFDVPRASRGRGRKPEWIWKSFAEVLPTSLRNGVREALARTSLSWASIAFRPRRYRTESGVALVGDVAGIFHPLTALGITMSVLDAEALAGAPSLMEYAVGRAGRSYIPELLSNAIYQAFVRNDAGSQALRDAIFASWRASPAHRSRTMELLGAASTSRTEFVRAFSHVAIRAGAGAVFADRRTIAELAGWLRWPWASVHPQPAAIRSRSLSWAAPESWALPYFLRSPQPLKEKQHAN
jgi:2-polyprenyl-6-methoxyphenol hydroxylase-like FAD-dependent oxidoreductase